MTTKLKFLEHPPYRIAHPEDDAFPPEIRCKKCALAEHPKTGEKFLLWLSNGVHWALSRNDPAYGSGIRLGDIQLVK
jgi:hypothetical protein